MTAKENGLLDETRFDLDEEGKLRVYWKVNDYGMQHDQRLHRSKRSVVWNNHIIKEKNSGPNTPGRCFFLLRTDVL